MAPLKIEIVSPGDGRNVIGCFGSTINPATISAAIRSIFSSGPKILERAANFQFSQMKDRHDPDDCEGKHNRRPEIEDAVEIFSKCHRRERDRRSETDCRGNKSGHETDRRMINLQKENDIRRRNAGSVALSSP